MSKRIHVGGAVASLLVTAVVAASGGAALAAETSDSPTSTSTIVSTSERTAVMKPAVKRGASLTTSTKQADEGDRYILTVSIKSAAQASSITLEKYKPSLYGWDSPSWNPVKSVNPRGKAKTKFAVVATDDNTERYRAVVAYKKAKPFTSKPVGVTVWRWIPLSEYDPYYESQGSSMGSGTVTIDGHSYAGWGPYYYSHTGSWEARFTPGRHCTDLKGVLGLSDISADGSSGSIAFTADDQTIYQSPTLTPGMALPVTVPLPSQPYRFGLRLSDTTPGGTTGRDAVESWPVIGEPAFRCTGV